MDHTTIDTDTAALMAEVDALIAETAEQDARIEALLSRPVRLSVTSQLAALRALADENAAALDAIEREQAAIAAELEAMGL